MPALKAIANLAPINLVYAQCAAAGTYPDAYIFTNPSTSGEYFEVVEVKAVVDVVGGASAAADVKIVPSGTALASGTTALAVASSVDFTATARTPRRYSLAATQALRTVKPGDSLAIDTSGTLTGLAGACVVVTLQPLRAKKMKPVT